MTELLTPGARARQWVTWHDHGNMALIQGKWRCTTCGHRLWICGIPPVPSRKLPPWTWHRELIDRYRAKHFWC